jgi:hypothetical protein
MRFLISAPHAVGSSLFATATSNATSKATQKTTAKAVPKAKVFRKIKTLLPRSRWLTGFLVVVVWLVVGAAAVRGQSALDGFDPNANDTVRVVVVQPDGKILIGGDRTCAVPQQAA